jgi:hypothetical protein
MVEPLLLPSVAGAMVAGGVAGGGDAAGGGALSLQAESTSAAARALRASFVFIDESPELYERSEPNLWSANRFIGQSRLPKRGFYRVSTLF